MLEVFKDQPVGLMGMVGAVFLDYSSISYIGERLFNCYVEYLKKAENFKVKEVYIQKYN